MNFLPDNDGATQNHWVFFSCEDKIALGHFDLNTIHCCPSVKISKHVDHKEPSGFVKIKKGICWKSEGKADCGQIGSVQREKILMFQINKL